MNRLFIELVLAVSALAAFAQAQSTTIDPLFQLFASSFPDSQVVGSGGVTPVSLPQGTTTAGGDTDCVCVPTPQCQKHNIVLGKSISCMPGKQVCCEPETVISGVIDNAPSTTDVPTQPAVTGNTCGLRKIDNVSLVDARLLAGDEASFGEFPWAAVIFQRKEINGKQGNEYQCVGSLIHPRVVLTAAHCVLGKGNIGVRLGEWNLKTPNEVLPVQNKEVKSIIVHEGYISSSLQNDVALLILKDPVVLAPHIGLICLPQQNERMDGRNCVVSGWGKDGMESEFQMIQKKIDLPIVSRQQCQDSLRGTRLGKAFILHTSFICAGGVPGIDACKGDGGAPLVCPMSDGSNTYVQAGITSWGIGCGDDVPGVYVDVSRFRDWIDNQIAIVDASQDS